MSIGEILVQVACMGFFGLALYWWNRVDRIKKKPGSLADPGFSRCPYRRK